MPVMLGERTPGDVVTIEHHGEQIVVEVGAMLGGGTGKKRKDKFLPTAVIVNRLEFGTLRPIPWDDRCMFETGLVAPDLETELVIGVDARRRLRSIGHRQADLGGGEIDPMIRQHKQAADDALFARNPEEDIAF